MSNLSTLPKGDSAWLLRKAIERIIQQVSVLETNIGSSTTGNSNDTEIIFNDAGTLRGDKDFAWNKTSNILTVDGSATITGDLTVDTSTLKVDSANNRVGIGTASPGYTLHAVVASGFAGAFRASTGVAGGLLAGNTAGDLVVGVDASGNGRLTADTSKYLGLGSNGINDRAILDSSGNVGIGVTPSAWAASRKAFELGGTYGAVSGNLAMEIYSNAYYNGTNFIYRNSSVPAALIDFNGAASGGWAWRIAGNGTAGNAITFTQAMTLDSAGRLGIGFNSMVSNLQVSTSNTGTSGLTEANSIKVENNNTTTGNAAGLFLSQSGDAGVGIAGIATSRAGGARTSALAFYYYSQLVSSSPIEGMRLDSSGNLLVGTTSANGKFTVTQTANANAAYFTGNSGNFIQIYGWNVDNTWNANPAAIFVGKQTSSSRSINAGGTINASGADYAEYMTKAGNFSLAKGDVAGIDASGKLTNVFADAVSFVVKSTDPSYVGNDKWGVDLEGADLETARQLVDRIAFAGQVPVNVIGASAGDYIVPVADGTGIKGVAIKNPTFEQYQIAVGKVIAIETDGRARIIVKVS